MPGDRRHRSVQLLRQGLLALLVVFLGVITAVLIARRREAPPKVERDPLSPLEQLADIVSAGEGFEYEVTEGDRTLFHIRADRMKTSRENLFELEMAFIEIEKEDGRIYEVTADRATYQDEGREKETTLRGNAVVKSSTGAEIRSDGFEVRRKGRLVTNIGPVSYRLGNRLTGKAEQLEAYLKQDRYQLSGNVEMVGGPEDPDFSLSCRRLIYDEADRRIHAEGDVVLVRGGAELRAGRISVTLADDNDDIRFVRARWNVTGVELSEDEFSTRVLFETADLAMLYDEETGKLERGELEADEGARVLLEISDLTQVSRRLTASFITVDFADQKPVRVEAIGGVEITEALRFAPDAHLLRTCSETALAAFSADGNIESMTLSGKVDLHQPDFQSVGDMVVRHEQEGTTRVTGEPAAVYSRRGELLAQTIVHHADEERVEASGGVRAEFAGSSGFAMIREEAEGDEPVRVTSETASWQAELGVFGFSGSVRAWQGEDFVIANDLIAEEGGEVLRARGRVKTVIKSRRGEEEDATEEERAPVEVTAGELAYRREERTLRYTGSPVARQAGRLLRCEDLEIALDEASELERMICQGSVMIEDPGEKRMMRGDRAVYDPGAALIEVSGRPAVMTDPEGREVRGSVVVYDLESGTARVRSGVVPPLSDPEISDP